ncbi:MAG: hypothetical protein ACTS6A_02595 [Candidatus Hodgkinia cicadicola]
MYLIAGGITDNLILTSATFVINPLRPSLKLLTAVSDQIGTN